MWPLYPIKASQAHIMLDRFLWPQRPGNDNSETGSSSLLVSFSADNITERMGASVKIQPLATIHWQKKNKIKSGSKTRSAPKISARYGRAILDWICHWTKGSIHTHAALCTSSCENPSRGSHDQLQLGSPTESNGRLLALAAYLRQLACNRLRSLVSD